MSTILRSACVSSITSLSGVFQDVTPGTLDPNHALYPGQVDGQGCVFPRSVQTIGNQLDAAYPFTAGSDWREYAEDAGNDPARDGGVTDPLGGTDCAHPVQVNGTGADDTNAAEGPNATGSQVKSAVTDQYANRHNPFIYFHSVIDNSRLCARDVVPLGTATTAAGGSVSYAGHLAQDLKHQWSTPRFAFITPNLCDDGHDATCAGVNDAGTTTGGLVGADDWLKAWMPLIFDSPAYRSGSMLVMVTFDEGGATDTAGSYNHYSALRTFEDLLGIRFGGADGRGHLGFAATATDFGSDVFNARPGH